jgi:hypothetical protein
MLESYSHTGTKLAGITRSSSAFSGSYTPREHVLINYNNLLIHKAPVARMKTGLILSNQTFLTGLMPRKPRLAWPVKCEALFH